MLPPIDTAHLSEVVFAEFFQSDLGKKVFLPTFDATINADWDIALLADNAAEAARFAPNRKMCKSIC